MYVLQGGRFGGATRGKDVTGLSDCHTGAGCEGNKTEGGEETSAYCHNWGEGGQVLGGGTPAHRGIVRGEQQPTESETG